LIINSAVITGKHIIIIYQMSPIKKILAIGLILILCSSVKLSIPSTLSIVNAKSALDLSCTQASGSVTYSVNGLPSGFILRGSSIVYTGNGKISGKYPIQVKVTDASGKTDSTSATLSINIDSTSGKTVIVNGKNVDVSGSTGGIISGGASTLSVNIDPTKISYPNIVVS
jgi:hypothetical protein